MFGPGGEGAENFSVDLSHILTILVKIRPKSQREVWPELKIIFIDAIIINYIIIKQKKS